MITGQVAMWLGYQALAGLVIPGVFGTLAGILIAWLVFKAGNSLLAVFEPIEQGSGKHKESGVRKLLGYQGEEVVPGLWIGRLLMLLAILIGLFYWMLLAWNVPHSDIKVLSSYFTEGFSFGAINIVPSKIIAGILAFFLLLTLAKWLRNQLAERWLKKTRLDIGARESIVSLTSYAIIGIAMVIALSMAGFDFQNIAIIAGALSVGIGFGLQNIVNNFISGLILLFERPVKPGDWVVVGSTEGHVKKISIRYTLIETWDRADVMVPNSELISTQVTNWMLRDSLGRVIVPVGVAYGSDVQKVKEILLKVATQHPLVLLHDRRVSTPQVMFMGFGESSLDFEVRCFIRDVDNRLSVRSDLLFAIDDEFRKADIEIPFPQRVVHMRNKDKDQDKEKDIKEPGDSEEKTKGDK
jgi:small-conductance mechanosensitive channel